jgi:hypothetical protein
VARLVATYAASPLEIERDAEDVVPGLEGFTKQPEGR